MTLANLFDRQLTLLEELLSLLNREQQQLSLPQPNGTELETIAGLKAGNFQSMEHLEQSRRQLQLNLGFDDDASGTEAAARQAGCLTNWQTLQDLARRVQRVNQLNGGLINVRLSANQKILNFMREVRGVTLYGPDGQSSARSATISSSA